MEIINMNGKLQPIKCLTAEQKILDKLVNEFNETLIC